MTVILNLPPDVEQALILEASSCGLSLDEYVSQFLIFRTELSSRESMPSGTIVLENGVPVLSTGQPLETSIVDGVLETLRMQRERSTLGNAL